MRAGVKIAWNQTGPIKALERRRAALSLRKQGLRYREIADRLGVSRQTAFRYVRDSITAIAKVCDETAEELRAIELDRLEALHKAHYTQALAGSLDATKVVLQVADRRAKLLGLDAPTKADVRVTPYDRMTEDEVLAEAKRRGIQTQGE